VSDPVTAAKLEILARLPDAEAPVTGRRIRLAYRLTPHRIVGTDRIRGVEFIRTGTTATTVLDAGLLLTSTGYRGAPVPGLPFDDAAAVVPNTAGRVVDPDTGLPVVGAYVAGWIKRGPTGFIGTNKSCAMQTVAALVDDYNADRLNTPRADRAELDRLVRARQPQAVDSAGWHAIDAAEIAHGAATGRPRVKFTSVVDMLAAAGATDDQSRGSAVLRRLGWVRPSRW
jgi:ferredoxin--NADP+ reductase